MLTADHFTGSCGLLVVVLLAGAVALYSIDCPPLGIASGALGLTLLTLNEIFAYRRRLPPRWVIDTGSGFRWIGFGSESPIEDTQITSVRIERERQFYQGKLQAIIRRFEVWLDEQMPPLVMSNRLAGDFIDPLGTMITRIVDGLTERSAERLAAGGILEGEGFRLSRMELAVSNGRKTLHLPFAEIDYLAPSKTSSVYGAGATSGPSSRSLRERRTPMCLQPC